MNNNLKLRVEELRKEKGMTQRALANWLSVSPSAVSKWEKGLSFPDTYLLPKLATLFNVKIDSLFDYRRIMDVKQKELLLEKMGYSNNEAELSVIWKEIKELVSQYYSDYNSILQLLAALSVKTLPQNILEECMEYSENWLKQIREATDDIEKLRCCTMVEGNLLFQNKDYPEVIRQCKKINKVEFATTLLLVYAYKESGEMEKSLAVLDESYELSMLGIIQVKVVEIELNTVKAESNREFCRSLFQMIDVSKDSLFILAIMTELDFFDWYCMHSEEDKWLEVAEDIKQLLQKRAMENNFSDSSAQALITNQMIGDKIKDWLNNLIEECSLSKETILTCRDFVKKFKGGADG